MKDFLITHMLFIIFTFYASHFLIANHLRITHICFYNKRYRSPCPSTMRHKPILKFNIWVCGFDHDGETSLIHGNLHLSLSLSHAISIEKLVDRTICTYVYMSFILSKFMHKSQFTSCQTNQSSLLKCDVTLWDSARSSQCKSCTIANSTFKCMQLMPTTCHIFHGHIEIILL